jgi:hypothetical protein
MIHHVPPTETILLGVFSYPAVPVSLLEQSNALGVQVGIVARHDAVYIFRLGPRFGIVQVATKLVGEFTAQRAQQRVGRRHIPQTRARLGKEPQCFLVQ